MSTPDLHKEYADAKKNFDRVAIEHATSKLATSDEYQRALTRMLDAYQNLYGQTKREWL
jgi:nitric oxide reductase large subunit